MPINFPIEGPFRKLYTYNKIPDTHTIYGKERDSVICLVVGNDKAQMVVDSLNYAWEKQGELWKLQA